MSGSFNSGAARRAAAAAAVRCLRERQRVSPIFVPFCIWRRRGDCAARARAMARGDRSHIATTTAAIFLRPQPQQLPPMLSSPPRCAPLPLLRGDGAGGDAEVAEPVANTMPRGEPEMEHEALIEALPLAQAQPLGLREARGEAVTSAARCCCAAPSPSLPRAWPSRRRACRPPCH
jgi:hypothetical protein